MKSVSFQKKMKNEEEEEGDERIKIEKTFVYYLLWTTMVIAF